MNDDEAHAYAQILISAGYKLSKPEYYRMRRWFERLYQPPARCTVHWNANNKRQWWEVHLYSLDTLSSVVWLESDFECDHAAHWIETYEMKRKLLISFGHAVAKTRRVV